MKQLMVVLCTMGFGFAATAQTNPPTASPALTNPTATAPANLPEPTSATTPDNTRYLNHPPFLTELEKQIAPFNDKPCDIIFIGDSITARWLRAGKDIWEKYYEPRRALDFGIDGDKTQNVLWRLNNMDIQNLKPKVAVVMIGTNNGNLNTPHEIADGVKAVLANTQSVFPGVKIILVSLLPNQYFPDKMKQADSIIKSYADNSTIYWLDLVPLMPQVTITTPDGKTVASWKGLGTDRLHPDATGYQIWADAMEPILSKLLAGG